MHPQDQLVIAISNLLTKIALAVIVYFLATTCLNQLTIHRLINKWDGKVPQILSNEHKMLFGIDKGGLK